MDTLQSIVLPSRMIEDAMATTGKRTPRAAFKALLDLRHVPSLARESEAEFRAGKGKRFRNAKSAMKWLES